jgi:hypothetical protein
MYIPDETQSSDIVNQDVNVGHTVCLGYKNNAYKSKMQKYIE